MSHFSVAVLYRQDQSVEELLAPYDENLEVEPYVRFTQQEAVDYVRKNFLLKAHLSDQECYNFLAEDYGEDYKDEDGNLYSTRNPSAKWDWYVIGGRFAGLLKAKTGKHGEGSAFAANPKVDGAFDVARVGDVDFSSDVEKYMEATRFWEVYVEGKPLRDRENADQFSSFYPKEWYLDEYKDKETFLKAVTSFQTFACVTPDGEWHECGQMGWFGESSETADERLDWTLNFKKRFIDIADPDWLIAITDCHI